MNYNDFYKILILNNNNIKYLLIFSINSDMKNYYHPEVKYKIYI